MDNLKKKEAAQEVSVQEQYTGNCDYCKKYNEITLPSRINTAPGYCVKCGHKMVYSESLSASLSVVRSPQKGQ